MKIWLPCAVLALLVPAAPAAAVEQTAPLSADGRYRAHQTGRWGGVEVTDRTAGHSEHVSVDSDGRFQPAEHPALDWSGRHVVFTTRQPLVVDDTNLADDVYVRDRACPWSDRIAPGDAPAISGSGRHVAFVTGAALDPADTNASGDVYVADRGTGGFARASLGAGGRQIPGGWASRLGAGPPAISADGRYVAFVTHAGLAPGDTDGLSDVYRHDRVTGATVRISVANDGRAGRDANAPSMSADGNVVAFSWYPPGGGERQAWVRDVRAGDTHTVTEWPASSGGRGLTPSVSADGELVAFAGNQLWNDDGMNREFDAIHVYDRVAHDIRQFGHPGEGGVQLRLPAISADGRHVSWTNAGTTGGVYDRGPGSEHPVPALAPFDPPCRPRARSPYRSAVIDARPAAYFRFGEDPGLWTAHDEMRPDLEAWTGGASGAVPGALLGDPNGALALGGQGEPGIAIGSGGLEFPGRASFSLEAWVRARDLNANTRRVFSSESARGGFLVGARADGIVFSRHAGGRWSTLRAPLEAERWTHVVATFDGVAQVMRLYVDGVRTGALASTVLIPPVERFDRHLEVGALGRWRVFSGALDEVAVYDRALDPARIAAHHRLGASPPGGGGT